MTGGLLLAGVLVMVVAAGVWRRLQMPPERLPQVQRSGFALRVEAYAFPLFGALIAGATLYFWVGWISFLFLGIGVVFLVAGVSAFRDLRTRG